MPFDGKDFVLPAVETDDVLRNLVTAVALIEKKEAWAKGQCFLGDKMCAYGAVARVWTKEHGNHKYDCVWNYLDRFVPAPFGCAANFNDHPTTTHADVLALFDRAIAARRAAIASTRWA